MSWTLASWVNNIVLDGSLARIAIHSELIFRHLGNGSQWRQVWFSMFEIGCLINIIMTTILRNNNNNNNKAFKSQTSWGRLELKPIRSNQGSGTRIAVCADNNFEELQVNFAPSN